jgi:aromatic ring hydroxylase
MPARTGPQYIAALKRLKPCIYLQGRRVEDVTKEPIFQGPIQTIAQLYDLQHDPRYRDSNSRRATKPSNHRDIPVAFS